MRASSLYAGRSLGQVAFGYPWRDDVAALIAWDENSRLTRCRDAEAVRRCVRDLIQTAGSADVTLRPQFDVEVRRAQGRTLDVIDRVPISGALRVIRLAAGD